MFSPFNCMVLDQLVTEAAAEVFGIDGYDDALCRLQVELKNNRDAVLAAIQKIDESAQAALAGYLDLPYDTFDVPVPHVVVTH